MKSWVQFKKWLVSNECHNLHDFKDLTFSEFKLVRSDQVFRNEVENGANDRCRKNKIFRID